MLTVFLPKAAALDTKDLMGLLIAPYAIVESL